MTKLDPLLSTSRDANFVDEIRPFQVDILTRLLFASMSMLLACSLGSEGRVA